MGFSISWLASRDLNKADLLARCGLRDTNVPDEANEGPSSVASLPNGWTVLFSNDFNFASPRRLESLSEGVEILGAQVEEHVMFSAAHFCQRGRLVWSVSHAGDKGRFDLVVRGTPPPSLAAICERVTKQQDAEPPGRLMAD